MNVANNHALDFGPFGQRQTFRRPTTATTSRTPDAPASPGSADPRSQGRHARLRPLSLGGLAAEHRGSGHLIRRAARRADVVIVAIHAGAEGADKTHTPRGASSRSARTAETPGIRPCGSPSRRRPRGRVRPHVIGESSDTGDDSSPTGSATSSASTPSPRRGAVTERGAHRPLEQLGLAARRALEIDSACRRGIPHPDRSNRSARLVRALSRQDFGRGAYPMGPGGKLR